MVGIARRTEARDLADDPRPARAGMIEVFEDQGAGAFAGHEARAVRIEGARSDARVGLLGDGPEIHETCKRHRRDGFLGAACQDHIGATGLDQAERVAYVMGAGRARRHRGCAGTAQAVADGQVPGGHILDHNGDEQGVHLARTLFGKHGRLLLEDMQAADAAAETKAVAEVAADDMILDIGPQSAASLAALLREAGTIVWNGPVGVFEFDRFAEGTRVMAEAIAESRAFSIAGGGDTLAAIAKFGIADKISYISTGGGAFLEFVEGKTLPAVEILEKRAKN